MIMTEQEAREKWCPYLAGSETIGQMDADGNQMTAYTKRHTARCIASDCMAWRWQGPQAHGESEDREPGKPRGYCGLAGDSNG